MATNVGVIPALMESLADARTRVGREYRHVRNYTTTSERMLRRYEGKENFPPGADIDALVAAYAEAVSTEQNPVSVFDLWDEAIRRARAATETDADRAGRAAAAARKAGAEMRKARERSPEQQRPTGAQGRTR